MADVGCGLDDRFHEDCHMLRFLSTYDLSNDEVESLPPLAARSKGGS
jgi:hypothetical protein